MDWYSTGIMSAINECKQSKSLLIVYVKDSLEGSLSTDNSWNDQQVQDILSGNSFVALQLLKDSVEFNQFMQFFPVFVIPSILCISPSGDQLAAFSGPADAKQLAITLKQGFQRLVGPQQPVSPDPTTTSSTTTTYDDDDGLSQQHQSTTATAIANSDDEEDDMEDGQKAKKQEQIRRYREKMAQNKLEKEEEAKKREKSNEMRRRREGREMSDRKKEQQDKERQALIKERQRERNEQMKARQEVLAKLEQDKQEKLSRQRSSSGTTQGGSSLSSTATPIVPSVFSAVGNNSSCRIQVKLPGAQSTIFMFESSDTVANLRQKVAEHVEYSCDKVMLTCVYPRKELGMDLDDTTLDQHGLVPNGVVIARLKGSKGSGTGKDNGNGVLSLFYSLFQFILQLLVSLKNAITGLFTSRGGEATSQQTNNNRQSSKNESSRFKRVKADDEDDPNKTYNGNSTQQL